MSLLIHDYAGHEFPVQLAKEFVRRGNATLHSHCSSNVTPHANFASAADGGVELLPIDLGRPFEKHKRIRRMIDEVHYGLKAAAQLRSETPEQLIAAQIPVISLLIMQAAAKRLRIPMVLWLQDLQGDIARTQSKAAGAILTRLEKRALRRADTIVTISDEMASAARAANPASSVTVIENWADVDKIKPGVKENAWAIEHGVDRSFNFVYSGTLGVKHRPKAIVALAKAMQLHGDVRIIVVSQGAGTDELTRQIEAQEIYNVSLLPLQPAEVLPDVLASADVMVALLEADAATGCVPSKILAYLAAGRPTLGLFPSTNLASRILNERSKAGLAVESITEFVSVAEELRKSSELRGSMGANARRYAEQAFNISTITDQFEELLRTNRGESHARPQ